MKVFITGADGQLSKSIIPLLEGNELYLANRKTLDITDKKQVAKSIKNFMPDIIFHFASKTRGDECAKDPESAYKINVEGTRYIVDAAKNTNAAIVFVSTNEVFDGNTSTPYKETSPALPVTVVGKNKLEAEEIIRKNIKKHFIIRTMWLYSEWSSNFLHAVFNAAKKNAELRIVDDEIGSPTNSKDLANAIMSLIKTKKYGTYHLVNEGVVSRFSFAQKAFEIVKHTDVSLIPIKLAEYKRLSKPPLYSALDTKKAKSLGIVMRDWKEALKEYLLKFHKNTE